MIRKAKTSASPVVAIEIRHSTLAMVLFEPALPSVGHRDATPNGQDGTYRVRTRSIRWRKEAHSPHSERGIRELTGAMKALAVEERLAGARVSITLDGEYCVTRVATGTTDDVQGALATLAKHSELYLLLGSGGKSLARTLYELDARHQHALLSIANGNVLEAVLQVAANVGMEVELVEHSLVSLCRLVGYARRDVEGPALVIGLSERGVELGISHRGCLLLDYRPGGRAAQDEVADIVMRHLARLRRYCDRYYRYARGEIKQVFLCGPPELTESAVSQFDGQGQLTVRAFEPASVDATWQFTGDGPTPRFCAALGTALRTIAPDQTRPGPNLMGRTRRKRSRPLWREVARTFWPVLAALLVAVAVFAAGRYERSRCGRLASDLDRFESSAAELWELRCETAAIDAKTSCLQAIADGVSGQAWETMISRVARCMPEDLWLDKMTADHEGKVRLTGNSYREAAIYEFVDHLGPSPGWSHVAVEGIWPASTRVGQTTKFDVQCKFGVRNDDSGERSRDE